MLSCFEWKVQDGSLALVLRRSFGIRIVPGRDTEHHAIFPFLVTDAVICGRWR